MSVENSRNYLATLNSSQINFLYGFINLNQWHLAIDWDLDQTLAISEDPVKAAVDAKYGTNYMNRRIDGFDTLTRWLVADGFNELEARNDERHYWKDNKTLSLAKPNEYLRWLSFIAYERNIPQFVTTVRDPGLRQMTYKWVHDYFPWITAGKINFRISDMNGDDFKVGSILNLHDKYPGLIHVDDYLPILKRLANETPDLGLIGIKYPGDDIAGLNHSPNGVFIEREILNSLIPYRPHEEDMIKK